MWTHASRWRRRVRRLQVRLYPVLKFTSDAISSYRRGGLRSYIDRSAILDFRSRQDALNERYGELCALINANGTTQMTMPALGVISHDVIQDAINDLDDSNY